MHARPRSCTEARHVDLCAWVRENVALPISGIGLKDVSGYFRIRRSSDMGSGLEAQSIWTRYRRTGQIELRDKLIAYNREDVDCLVHVVEALRAILDGKRPLLAS